MTEPRRLPTDDTGGGAVPENSPRIPNAPEPTPEDYAVIEQAHYESTVLDAVNRYGADTVREWIARYARYERKKP